MQEFPKIEQNEYAILFAEKNTGIVVDQYGERHIQKPYQKMYMMVGSYEEAESLIVSRLLKQPHLEGCIFNSLQEILKVID
ncbi:MAG: hypothetical protein JNL70_23195 [Saprospiraceae bacterium]|nr:hypothetical protein [Saprospiraceae bacterium]